MKTQKAEENLNEMQLADKMMKILKDSQAVQDSVKALQAQNEIKDRLLEDFKQLKGKEEWLKLIIKKREDSFDQISSGKELEEYQKHLVELPAVKKTIKLMQRRVDPNLNASVYRDIKDCEVGLETAIHSALRPISEELQKKLDELTNSFLEDISLFASAFIRVKLNQDLVNRSHFPHGAIGSLIPKIQNFDRLEAYADDFHKILQARGA
ncbi:MAG: hypothetical protein K9K37_07890 [Desulfocapsa sp.]|nr:hypothetical protein [Desulfocapsa sp.]